jgi:hypothetical protein
MKAPAGERRIVMAAMLTAPMAALLAIAFLLGACGGEGGSSIPGTYECSLAGAGPGKSIDHFEFRDDGTISQEIESLRKTFEGTWSQEGDSVKISSEAGDTTLRIEGDRLVDEHEFTCTPTG